MSAPALSGEKLGLVHRLADEAAARGEEPNFSRIGEAAGVNRDTVRKHLRLRGISPRGEKPDLPEPAEAVVGPASKTMDVSGDKAECVFLSDRKIVTEKDALEYGEIDASVWYIKRMKIGAWTTPMRVRRGQDGEKRNLSDQPSEVQCWRISLELERILPAHKHAALDAIFERFKDHKPDFGPVKRVAPRRGRMMEIDLFDHHFGKLAWSPETRQDYDLKIAERLFKDAVEDMTNEAAPYEIESFLVPLGNDFLHIDNLQNTTTNGTPQDVDGRMAKIIEVGQMAVIGMAEYLRRIAPVKFVRLPGNHDYLGSLFLAKIVAAWFRDARDVEVDTGPSPRKYVEYGRCMIGLTHGNEEKPDRLPSIMATEEPEMWGRTTWREFHLGHNHKAKRVRDTEVDTYEGTVVRWLRSLSATDAWHHRRGFVGGVRAAEAFLWDKDRGWTNCFQATLRAA